MGIYVGDGWMLHCGDPISYANLNTSYWQSHFYAYTDATTITKRMVAELIDHIEVYHAEKQDGITNQRVVIHYNCIGAFDVPDRRKIPEADIIMETRKGVALSYAPEQVAV